MHPSIDLVRRGLSELGLEAESLVPRLSTYMEEIELWNPAWGLVNATGDELAVKHILDSLAPLGEVRRLLAEIDAARATDGTAQKETARLTDLGTGAGLPGIPLAIAMPERRVLLVERMGKRVGFLRNQKAILGLTNVEIREEEAERAKGPFDLVVFRAFRPFSETKLFKAIARTLAPGGIVAAYKGQHAKAAAELAELAADPKLGALAQNANILPLKVPFLDEERCLVILRS